MSPGRARLTPARRLLANYGADTQVAASRDDPFAKSAANLQRLWCADGLGRG